MEILNYNRETGILTWKKSLGRRTPIGGQPGTVMKKGYRRVAIDGNFYMAHHLAWFYVTRRWPFDQIDHINGIRDDNRICNLREATGSQNARNSKKPITNTSGYKGVSFRKDRKMTSTSWMAYIRVNEKKLHLGFYRTAAEAHSAYCAAAIRYYGEFARAA